MVGGIYSGGGRSRQSFSEFLRGSPVVYRMSRCGIVQHAKRTENSLATPLHELAAQVLSLGAAERARLLERLIASFEPDTHAEKTWVAEALQREADVKAGRSQMILGSDALARIEAGIG